MGQPVDELAMIGEQDQSECVRVKSADRYDASMGPDQIEHRRAAPRVGRGGDDPGRLVQREVDMARIDVDPFSVHLDPRACRVDPHALNADDAPVDRDPALFDQLLGRAS